MIELPDPDAPRLLLGVGSGTSADGIDLALIEIRGNGTHRQVRFLAGRVEDYPAGFQPAIHRAHQWGVAEIAQWHARLGRAHADAAAHFLARHRVEGLWAVGSHGQTVFHHDGNPDDGSLQLGDGSYLARACGCPVVSDLRWADLALGGQGAPISPWADWVLHRHQAPRLAILNLGGIANLTLLRGEEPPLAWDCGPANGPLDALVQARTGQTMDEGGALAAAGQVLPELFSALCADPWFQRSLPRSTGLERFGRPLTAKLPPSARLEDLLATLAAVSAWAVAESLSQAEGGSIPAGLPIHLCGGGAHNSALVAALEAALPACPIRPYRDLWPGPAAADAADLREAIAFALLADACLWGEPATWPTTTGCRTPAILGKIIPAPI